MNFSRPVETKAAPETSLAAQQPAVRFSGRPGFVNSLVAMTLVASGLGCIQNPPPAEKPVQQAPAQQAPEQPSAKPAEIAAGLHPQKAEESKEGNLPSADEIRQRFKTGYKGNMAMPGLIHGMNPQTNNRVFTYLDPENMFDMVHISVVPTTPEVAEALSKVSRNDTVQIEEAEIFNSKSRQPHLKVSKFSITAPWVPAIQSQPMKDTSNLPKIIEFLKSQKTVTAQVHSVPDEVAPLAVEVQAPGAGSVVLPIVVPADRIEEAGKLFRNDVLELPIEAVFTPGKFAPPHIAIKSAQETGPLKAVNGINAMGGTTTLSGTLAVWPQSPLTSRNTWAIKVVEPNGFPRFISISSKNMKDKALRDQINEKLLKVLQEQPDLPLKQRNIVVHPRITVTVNNGEMSIFPTQASIHINNIKDLEVTVAPQQK